MKGVTAVAAILLMATAALAGNPARWITADNNNSCDIGTYPAATLLLAYFEVDVTKPESSAANTIFTVINASRSAQIARVTIWTDTGYPAAWFNLFFGPFDVKPVSLWDVIVGGRFPPSTAVPGDSKMMNAYIVSTEHCGETGTIPEETRAALQTMLTSGVSSSQSCRVGTSHPMAIGYVTVDLVNSCSNVSPTDPSYYSKILLYDNVLTGDYERINPDTTVGNYAGGNPLVHIRAIPEGGAAGTGTTALPYTFYDRLTPDAARRIDRRQPLPSSFAARFIQGGSAAFATDYAIWREAAQPAAAGCTSTAAAMPFGSMIRFDEVENATTVDQSVASMTLPATSAPATRSAAFPPMAGFGVAGWMYLNLDNRGGTTAASAYSSSRASQNWVIVHMRAEGRYAVDFDATSLSNGCSGAAAEPITMAKPKVHK